MSVEEVGRFAPLSPRLADIMSRLQQKDVLSLFKSYEQLVDLLSNRLIRAMLVVLGENTTGWSARDAFRHMEARGSLADAQHFLTLVLLRNRLAHEYPMSAEKRAQRINETLELGPALLSAAERLLRDANNLLAEDEPEPDEPEPVDIRHELAASIPDDIWVWGADRDGYPDVWIKRSNDETPPTLTEAEFRNVFETVLADRIRGWQAWELDNPDVCSISEVINDAFCGGLADDTDPDALAEIVVRSTDTSRLVGGWGEFDEDSAWPVAMWPGSQSDVTFFRERLFDDPDLAGLIEFWGCGPRET
ncbi:MAG: hypothetical protein ACFCUS_13760 [Rubrimonas sp.]|uniref:hypothetical protein n=1 Tax=Rubrimonas sp. TaxID=2036015 RepID=UPI002FDE9DFC